MLLSHVLMAVAFLEKKKQIEKFRNDPQRFHLSFESNVSKPKMKIIQI